ncbi:hypothetical protein [Bradyrhizobium sp. 151]|uniref:hypothetical protein n=1 Tax=Bradyrhizobium sp. 151 TaxID=2782626 RepID=UPI001FF855EE|nr:hypothetical protein [Bradyrhizobium sp. 151]MCK1656483.1 hypothetical protein [Bradyrhizobium sp. 151]
MPTEMGEYLVGAYLKLVLGCSVVDYNARPQGGGLQGLGELDVIGFDFVNRNVYLCEVTTHLDGLLIGGGGEATIAKLADKHARQKLYAERHLHLPNFKARFMFWSPVVRPGLVSPLKGIGFELFINRVYRDAIDELRVLASSSTSDANNPAFRLLQILEHMREPTGERSAL